MIQKEREREIHKASVRTLLGKLRSHLLGRIRLLFSRININKTRNEIKEYVVDVPHHTYDYLYTYTCVYVCEVRARACVRVKRCESDRVRQV
jgi:hypothetical protein